MRSSLGQRLPLSLSPAPLRRCAPARAAFAEQQGEPAAAPRFVRCPHAKTPILRQSGSEEQWLGQGAKAPRQPDHYRLPTYEFPALLCAEPPADKADLTLPEWAALASPYIDVLLREAGAVLVRNVPCHSAADHQLFLSSLGYRKADYITSFIERGVEEGLYNASANPPSFLLNPHNENVFYPAPPDLVIFSMLQPATEGGGETLLLRNETFTEALDPHILEGFVQHGGVRYKRWYPSFQQKWQRVGANLLAATLSVMGLQKGDAATTPLNALITSLLIPTWSQHTKTSSPQEAAKQLQDLGLEVSWDEGGGLVAENTLPTMRLDRFTGRHFIFNFADSAGIAPYFEITYGDGTPIGDDLKNVMRDAMLACSTALPLQKGDMIFFDNTGKLHGSAVMHGRTPYKGDRKLLVDFREV